MRQSQPKYVIRSACGLFACLIGLSILMADVASAKDSDGKEKPAPATRIDPAARKDRAPRDRVPRDARPLRDPTLRQRVGHLKAAMEQLRAAGLPRQADEVETILLRTLLQAFEGGRPATGPPASQSPPAAHPNRHPHGPAPKAGPPVGPPPVYQEGASNQIKQEGNGNWNNKIEIRWQNITHVHPPEKK